MRRLILFRHAKAEAGRPGGGDFDRRLTGRGRREALAMGKELAARGIAPDLVLTSAACRARETWEYASPAFGETRIQALDELYNASPHEIMEQIRAFQADGDTLVVVGHNPGLQELAVDLVADGAGSASDIQTLTQNFPTSTAAVFVLDAAGRFALEGFLLPQRDAKR